MVDSRTPRQVPRFRIGSKQKIRLYDKILSLQNLEALDADQHQDLIQKLIRPLFLRLTFERSDNTQALATQLGRMQSELLKSGELVSSDRRLIPAKHQLYVMGADNSIALKSTWKGWLTLLLGSLIQEKSTHSF